mmetsp:Transcript_41137/g.94630  ORF Transcript_41137/g.94630 Transcript_41137/m.94630 type:complete len:111 (+) Transcript_41137:92-424(+)
MVASARRVSFGSAEVVYFAAEQIDPCLMLAGFTEQFGQHTHLSCGASGKDDSSLVEDEEREEMEALMQIFAKAETRRGQKRTTGFNLGLEVSLNPTFAESRIGRRRASLE